MIYVVMKYYFLQSFQLLITQIHCIIFRMSGYVVLCINPVLTMAGRKINNYSDTLTVSSINKKLDQSKHLMRIGHLNAQSIKSCIDEAGEIIKAADFDLMGICETWLDTNTPKVLYEIADYKIIRNDRAIGTHGGVAIYLKKHIKSKIVGKSLGETRIEYLYLQIDLRGSKLVVCIFYIPDTPSVSEMKEFENLFTDVGSKYDNILVMGDFNVNLLSDTPTSRSFKQILTCLDLTFYENGPTRKNSLLDLIILRNGSKSKFKNFGRVRTSLSDHDMIFINYNSRVPKYKPTYIYIHDIDNVNIQQLFCEAEKLNWQEIYCTNDCNIQLKILYDNINYLFNNNVSRKKVLQKDKDHKWINPNILSNITIRDRAYKIYLKSKSDADKQIYQTLRAKVKRDICNSKKHYFNGMLNPSLNNKKLYSNIREVGLMKNNLLENVMDPDELNKHFTLSCKGSAALVCPDVNFSFDSAFSGFSFVHVNEMEVWQYFANMKSNAVGTDGVPTKFIRLLMPIIITHVTHIFNTCITTSIFPTMWKSALIIPVPKVAHPENAGDFRPISILCALSKVFEKVLSNQILEYLHNNKHLLDEFQCGYKKHHSTVTGLLKVISDITENMDASESVLLVMLDFSKAFDMVGHASLVSKLRYNFQFSNPATNLIYSYLNERLNTTKVGDKFSSPLSSHIGVPQGSILGPLLFVMYSNDLNKCLKHCSHISYADDVQLYLTINDKNKQERVNDMNHDLSVISRWSNTNNLRLNTNKSQAIILSKFKKIDSVPDVMLNGIPINYSTSVKNLGIFVQSNLNWADQVSNMCRRIYGTLYRLRQLRKFTPIKTRYLLVKSLIIPLFSYGLEIFYNMNSNLRKRLEVCFNDCARYIYGINRRSHVSNFSQSILGCNIYDFFKYRVLCFIHKLIYLQQPNYLYFKLSFGKSVRSNNLILPKSNCKIHYDSLFVSGVTLWNKLPNQLKRTRNHSSFKELLKNFFNFIEPKLLTT